MKIVNRACKSLLPNLSTIADGTVIRFEHIVSSKHRQEDPFIVTEICSTYVPGSKSREWQRNMVGITNLRTGALAYYLGTRKVHVLRGAELCIPSE